MAYYGKKTTRKAIGRTYRKARKTIKKRYFKKNGLAKLTSDVMYLKSVLNPEKKRITMTGNGQLLGQCNQNAKGFWTLDVTPIPSEGATYNGRNGASIKLHSSHFNFCIYEQGSSSISRAKLRFELYLVKGVPYGSSDTFINTIYQTNNYVGGGGTIVDYNSDLNVDQYATYQKIRVVNRTIAADSLSNQKTMLNFSIGHKYFGGKGHHIRYAADANTVNQGQLILCVFCDSGNCGALSTLTNIPIQTASSGFLLEYSFKHYYYDN